MGSLAKQTPRPCGAKGGEEEGEDSGRRSPPNIPPGLYLHTQAQATQRPLTLHSRPTSVGGRMF